MRRMRPARCGHLLGGVEHGAAPGQGAGVDAHVDELPDVAVHGDLEGEGGEGFVVIGFAGDGFAASAGPCLAPGERPKEREEIHDRVEERLYALVAVGGAAQDGDHLIANDAPAQAAADFLLGQIFARPGTSPSALRRSPPPPRPSPRGSAAPSAAWPPGPLRSVKSRPSPS